MVSRCLGTCEQAVKLRLSNEAREVNMQARPPPTPRPKSASPRLARAQMSNCLSVDQLRDPEAAVGDTQNVLALRMIQSAQARQVQLRR